MSNQTLNKTLAWSFSTIQHEIYSSTARFRAAMIGRRGGKNEGSSAVVVDYAVTPDEYDYGAEGDPIIWWVGPTYTQTKKYGFHKVLNKLPDALIDGEPKRSAPFEISLKNGSQIEFYSFDRPESLQGAGVDFMVIDEAAYMDAQIWDNDLRPMLLDANGGAIFISKPLGENWFYEHYERGQSDEYPDWWSIHGTSYDNPWIDNDEIERVKQNTPEAIFRQQYLADPQAGGRLLTLDMLDSIPAEEWRDASDRWNWHIGVDIGVTMDSSKARDSDSDYWAVAVVAEHPLQPEAYVLDIARERGQTPTHAARWLAGLLDDIPTNKCYVEAVQAQRWFLEDCRDVGLQPVAVEHDRSKEERLMYLGVPFENDSVQLVDGVDWSDFKNEWAAFPDGSHDDQLDALEIALRHTNLKHQVHAESMDPYGQTDAE